MTSITIAMPNEWVAAAKAHKRSVDAMRRWQTSRFDAPTDSDIGRLGELCVHSFLLQHCPPGWSCEWANKDGESFLPHDFTVRNGYTARTLDSKTAAPSTSIEECKLRLKKWSYLYPENQDPGSKHYIVLVYVWPDHLKALLVGWIRGEVVAGMQVREKAVDGYQSLKFPIRNHVINNIADQFHDPMTLFDDMTI